MKILLSKTVSMVLLTLIAVTGFAQNNKLVKPPLFSKLPSTINCTATELNKFFAITQGQSTRVAFDNNKFKANGVVSSNLVRYKNLQSLAIKLPEFNNAIFALSKRTDDNNNTFYSGRIINQLNADAYELKRIDANKYQLVKVDLEYILPTCAQ